MPTATQQRESRRRRREQTRDAVVSAAIDLSGSSTFKDLTVDEIARAAGVSRPAFYLHFEDKSQLLLAAVERVAATLYEESDRWWHGEGDPPALVREAIAGVAAVYEENASLMRIATEVSTYDEEVREFWTGLVGRFISATAEHLAEEAAAGRISNLLDPESTADALVWMTERSCYIHLGRGERSAAQVTESLVAVWVATLYGAQNF